MSNGLKTNATKRFVYLTRIDSDDMFHREVIADIQKEMRKERQAVLIPKGYVLFHDAPSAYKWLKWKLGALLTKLKLK